jgi:hypothetical protein
MSRIVITNDGYKDTARPKTRHIARHITCPSDHELAFSYPYHRRGAPPAKFE